MPTKRRTFTTPMPKGRVGQRHGNPHTDNNYPFWDSLPLRGGVDIDLRIVWHNPKRKNKAGGLGIYCLHGETAAGNGYAHILTADGKRVRKMHRGELHRPLDQWTTTGVDRWRRGPHKTSEHPVRLASACRYLRTHGGTGVFELKSREFRFKWVVQQAVNVCHAEDHPPWFKALSNMAFVEKKAAAVTAAHVGDVHGQFALIFGDSVKGRNARTERGQSIIRTWDPVVRANTRIW